MWSHSQELILVVLENSSPRRAIAEKQLALNGERYVVERERAILPNDANSIGVDMYTFEKPLLMSI